MKEKVEAAGIEPLLNSSENKHISTPRGAKSGALWLQSADIDMHELARIGSIIDAWTSLLEHIKLAVEALCFQSCH